MGIGGFIKGIIPGPIDDILIDKVLDPIGDAVFRFAGGGGGRPPGDVVTQPGGPPARIADPGGDGYYAGGCAIELPLASREIASCPPGYVAVDKNRDGYADTCMLKKVAIGCGLWKSRPKPVLTASDKKALNRAQRVIGKVDTVVKQTNEIQGKARYTRAKSKR